MVKTPSFHCSWCGFGLCIPVLSNIMLGIRLFCFFFLNFTYLFLAVLGLCYCTSFSLVAASRGYSLAVVCGLQVVVASLVGEHKL